jgi:hypothetical protein
VYFAKITSENRVIPLLLEVFGVLFSWQTDGPVHFVIFLSEIQNYPVSIVHGAEHQVCDSGNTVFL